MPCRSFLCLCGALVLASCGPPRFPPPMPPARPADRAPVFTADGHVLGVERSVPEDPQSYVHIIIAVDGREPVRVELAPGWYLDEQGLRFSKDDLVGVEGQSTVREGKTIVVARRVRSGESTVPLRDNQGHPAWEK